MYKIKKCIACAVLVTCTTSTAVAGLPDSQPEALDGNQATSQPESLVGMLNAVRVIDHKTVFDNARFNAALRRALAEPAQWPRVADALRAKNVDILYNGLRQQAVEQRQAFYEWALTRGDVKDQSALEMIAEGLAEATHESHSKDVWALVNVGRPSLLATTLAGAFVRSRQQDVEGIVDAWKESILDMGCESSGPDVNMLVGRYVCVLLELESPVADKIICECILKYVDYGDISEIDAAIRSLGSRKVGLAFQAMLEVADSKTGAHRRVTAIEALVSIAATHEQRDVALTTLKKVLENVKESEDSEGLVARLDSAERKLLAGAATQPKDR